MIIYLLFTTILFLGQILVLLKMDFCLHPIINYNDDDDCHDHLTASTNGMRHNIGRMK